MTYFNDPATGLVVLKKQPSESRLYDFDFSAKMREGDSVASIVSVSAANRGNVAGSGDVALVASAISGQFVQLRIEGGDDKEDYKITAKITTTPAGDTLEGDGMLYVRNS